MGERLDPVSRTARWTAAARAAESERPDAIFRDPLAGLLAGERGRELMAAFDGIAGGNPYLPLRTRFFDDFLVGATGGRGPRQVVLPAAGFDARAYRLPWPAGTILYEIDRPEVLDEKEELLAAAGADPACERRVVAADLAGDWATALTTAGFDPAAPSVWLAEGLFVYLDAETVGALLDEMAALAAPGSRVGADITGESLLTSPYMRDYLAALAAGGMAWRFGSDDPEGLFAAHGWRTDRVVQPGEPGADFRPLPWPTTPRTVPGLPRSYFAVATRAGDG